MKLHLPKQLFTALLAAITLAAPAAWGELYVETGGNFFGGSHAFTFTVTKELLSTTNTNDVLAYYGGSVTGNDYNVNAYVLNFKEEDGKKIITLSVGDGRFNGTLGDENAIEGSTTFDSQRGADFTTTLTEGETYLVKVTGGSGSQSVSLYNASTGALLETKNYNGNMNGGNQNTTMSSSTNASYSADGVYLWNATGDGSANFTGSNFWATPASITDKNVFFAADNGDTTIYTKTVNVTSAERVANMDVYDEYTFGGDGSLTVTGNLNIAAGASATFNVATTLSGTVTNNGTLTLNGSITIIGELSAFTQRGEATVSYQLADGTSSVGNNGFRVVEGASYWLTSESSTGTTNVAAGITTVLHGGNSYNLNKDDGGEGEGTSNNWYFQVDSNVGKVYYVTSGDVEVNNTVQTAATGGYVLQGGNMKLTAGSVNTSTITYTSGSITLSDGATLVLDAMPAKMTANSLLSSILSVARDDDESTQIGRLKITQETTLTTGFEATYTGAVEINNARLIAGEGPSQSVKLASISNFILNDGGELYYHANPTQAPVDSDSDGVYEIKYDIQKITVESGTGSFKLQDSDGASLEIGEISINKDATFKYWSNWGDSPLTVGTLSGGGTFKVESPDAGANNSPKTIIESLTGFEGNLQFVKDSGFALNVEVNTGEGDSVSFNSITITNSNGVMDFDFNVETDTTVGTINVTGTNNTINIASTGTLHAFTKAGDGTITLTGSGVYKLAADTTALTTDVTLDEDWTGTVELKHTSNSTIQKMDEKLEALGNTSSTVKLSGLSGWFNNGTLDINVDTGEKNNTAFTIVDGSCDNSGEPDKGAPLEFNKAISGSGDIVLKGWSGMKLRDTYIKISGDISKWDGNIYNSTTAYNAGIFNINFADQSQVDVSVSNKEKSSGSTTLVFSGSKTTKMNGAVDVERVEVKTDTQFNADVTASNTLTVDVGKTATVNATLSAGNVTISQQNATMSNVTVAGSTISSADTTGATKGSISNAQLTQLQQDASFTIQDMTLTNTTITAATTTTQVKLQNVEATDLALAKGKFTMNVAPTVGEGGTTAEFGSGVVSLLAVGSASLTLNMDVIGAYESTGAMDNVTLIITLDGITGDVSGYGVDNWKALVGFEENSWLGHALTGAQYTDFDVPPAAEGGVPSVNYGYTATGGDGSNVGRLVITISGLKVPEPTTATLSLLALAALAARRRRND